MAQSDRSNSIWHKDIIITCHSWLVLSCISSQWARCSTFKYLANAYDRSCSSLQKPSTFPSSTFIDLLRGDHVCYGGYSCYMCSSSISYMLTAACCGCIGSSKSRYLLCRSSSNSSIADLFRQDQIHEHCHVHYHENHSESCHDRTLCTLQKDLETPF